jgi:hypothetical protein
MMSIILLFSAPCLPSPPVFPFPVSVFLSFRFVYKSEKKNKYTGQIKNEKYKKLTRWPQCLFFPLPFCVFIVQFSPFLNILNLRSADLLQYFAQAKIHTHTHPEKGKTQKGYIQKRVSLLPLLYPPGTCSLRILVPASTTSDICAFVPNRHLAFLLERVRSILTDKPKNTPSMHPFLPCSPYT